MNVFVMILKFDPTIKPSGDDNDNGSSNSKKSNSCYKSAINP